MSQVRICIEGESYLTLEAISECYACEVTWMREAYQVGLFGRGVVRGDDLLLSVRLLDRVAEVVRLGRHHGLGFEVIALLVADPLVED